MGVISASNTTVFRDSSTLISNVKRFLSSYTAFNLIDEGEFYRYMIEIISQLGTAVFKEEEAIIPIGQYQGALPINFSQLYAAYKVTPQFKGKERIHEQSNGISMYSDITSELSLLGDCCEIECCGKDDKTIEKITVRNYVKEGPALNFGNPVLLRLGNNVRKDRIVSDSISLGIESPFEISIDNKFIYTNFKDDSVYLKYYGLPLDAESGLPQIPNINSVEKAIEWYIIYQVMLQLWFNSEVPDIQNKWQKAEQEYRYWFAQALYEAKLPTFQSMVDKIMFNKGNHRIYRQLSN